MDLESVSRYLKLTQCPNHTEVAYNGAPCLAVMEGVEGYSWAIVPVFARMVYGANTYSDIPWCNESFGDLEEAVADGISKLHELGAFLEYDIDQFDTSTTEYVTEECLALSLMYGKNILEASEIFEALQEEPIMVRNFHKAVKNAQNSEGKMKATHLSDAKQIYGFAKDHPMLSKKVLASYHKMVNESSEQLDEEGNAFTNYKSSSSSYDLPGHVVLDTTRKDGHVHVKRINKEGKVTTTKYGPSGSAVGRTSHEDQDPAPYFKKAGVELEKEVKKRGRPSASGHDVDTAVKKKIASGEELSRYEKNHAVKHGLIQRGKRGRPAKKVEEAVLTGKELIESLMKSEKYASLSIGERLKAVIAESLAEKTKDE